MAGRNRFSRRPENVRGFHDDPRSVGLHRGPILIHQLEEELDLQQREIQRLLVENRHVIDDNVMLDRELGVVKEEILRLSEVNGKRLADREVYAREWMERAMKLEGDLQSYESLRLEIKQLRVAIQKLMSQNQELSSNVQTLNKDANQLKTMNQQIPVINGEIDKMRKEVIDARRSYDFEKKANEELVEQNRAMETNIIAMAREIESLRVRAELVPSEMPSRGGVVVYPVVNESPETRYQGTYSSNAYGLSSRTSLDKRLR